MMMRNKRKERETKRRGVPTKNEEREGQKKILITAPTHTHTPHTPIYIEREREKDYKFNSFR